MNEHEPHSRAVALRCGGIVLCGGRSTRMGVAKCLLPFGDEAMLTRVVRLLAEAARPIVVVAAEGQPLPPLPRGVLIARDARPDRGPLEGLHAGFAALAGQVDAVYATSCDAPLLAPRFVGRLFEWLAEDESIEAVVPCDGDRRHPLAAVYRASMAPRIAQLLSADRLRLMDLLDACRVREAPVAQLREVDAELATLMNCNRHEDYLAALAAAKIDCDRAAQQLE